MSLLPWYYAATEQEPLPNCFMLQTRTENQTGQTLQIGSVWWRWEPLKAISRVDLRELRVIESLSGLEQGIYLCGTRRVLSWDHFACACPNMIAVFSFVHCACLCSNFFWGWRSSSAPPDYLTLDSSQGLAWKLLNEDLLLHKYIPYAFLIMFPKAPAKVFLLSCQFNLSTSCKGASV